MPQDDRTAELERLNRDLVREISERGLIEKALESKTRELERSNAELERFALVVSHDLQEPLRSVSEFTKLLADRYRGRLDGTADEYIAFILDGADWMRAMIDDLLEYSRISSSAVSMKPVACEDALERAIKNLQHAIEHSGATITHGPLPTIDGDDKQIVQLFQNLIGNGIKFRGAEPPVIHVEAERAGPEWRFAVRDNGIGMEPEHVERIFVMFARLNSKQLYPGTGMGLTICRRIVERHGGRIWAESELGRGTTVIFALPTRHVT